MTPNSIENLTELIRLAGQGQPEAKEQAVGLVYEEIRSFAERPMRSERNVTLQPTALVNEVFLRLLDSEAMANAPNRAWFFAAAAQAMRRILIDQARRRKAIKRGGEYQRQPLDQVLDRYDQQNIDFVDLDEAISELEKISPRQARVVHLRWFMELKVKQVAQLLEVSVSTVEEEWRAARAFLRRRLDQNQ